MDDDATSKLRRLTTLKRKQLGALLSTCLQHDDTSSAVKVAKSAVDIRARPQNNKHRLLLKRGRKGRE
jgi:hypothetical protein